jgi:hypothetical protein
MCYGTYVLTYTGLVRVAPNLRSIEIPESVPQPFTQTVFELVSGFKQLSTIEILRVESPTGEYGRNEAEFKELVQHSRNILQKVDTADKKSLVVINRRWPKVDNTIAVGPIMSPIDRVEELEV